MTTKADWLASRCPDSIPHDTTAAGGKVKLDFSLGAAQQRAAWDAFEDWLHELSAHFCDDETDVPMRLLAEWFENHEPIKTTVGRCLDYRIANL